jgi:hypothetical protein
MGQIIGLHNPKGYGMINEDFQAGINKICVSKRELQHSCRK